MRNLVLITLSILAFNLASPAITAEESSGTQTLFEEAKRVGCEEYAPGLIEEAKSLYEKSGREFADKNHEKGRELETLSQIRAKTAISVARKKVYEDEIRNLQKEINVANSERELYEEELIKNVSRLKEIKDRISVSEERMRSIALDALERAAEKIKAADGVSAGVFAPGPFDKAGNVYREAEGKLTLGEYEESTKLSERAITFAESAYQDSKKKSDLGKEIIDKVSQVYRAKAELIEEGVRITLEGVFAPLSTVILFDAYPSLDSIAGILDGYPKLNLTIGTQPGNLMSKKENSQLLRSQAETVKNYMISKGISSERFKKVDGPISSKRDRSNKQGEYYIEIIVNLESE
ncbi:MAG TPA: hypothetical protein VHT73_17255 [Thermodesulfobacteriota bacterium]|nr:hypothetical protein [Thermodesulfobacteriota bacterium]